MVEAASNHGCDMLREGQLTVKDNSQAGDLSGNWKWCSFKVDSLMLKFSHLNTEYGNEIRFECYFWSFPRFALFLCHRL